MNIATIVVKIGAKTAARTGEMPAATSGATISTIDK
jgi:hypothetical protein